jgi:hypothetical protein
MHTSPESCLPACARVGDLTESAERMGMRITVLATGLDPERGLQTQQPVRASHRALRFLSRG